MSRDQIPLKESNLTWVCSKNWIKELQTIFSSSFLRIKKVPEHTLSSISKGKEQNFMILQCRSLKIKAKRPKL
jgi:hypothetical protein